MIIVLRPELAESKQIALADRLKGQGFYTRLISMFGKVLLSVDGPDADKLSKEVASWQDVEEVIKELL